MKTTPFKSVGRSRAKPVASPPRRPSGVPRPAHVAPSGRPTPQPLDPKQREALIVKRRGMDNSSLNREGLIATRRGVA